MSTGTRFWMAAWIAALLAGSVFLLSILASLAISPFGEVPEAMRTINALIMPWGILIILLAVVLRRIAGHSIRKGQVDGR